MGTQWCGGGGGGYTMLQVAVEIWKNIYIAGNGVARPNDVDMVVLAILQVLVVDTLDCSAVQLLHQTIYCDER